SLPRSQDAGQSEKHLLDAAYRGRTLFAPDLGYWKLSALLAAGARVKATRLSDSFGFAQYLAARPDHPVIPLFALNPKGYALPFTPDEELPPGAGWTVIGLHEDDANGAATPAARPGPGGSWRPPRTDRRAGTRPIPRARTAGGCSLRCGRMPRLPRPCPGGRAGRTPRSADASCGPKPCI